MKRYFVDANVFLRTIVVEDNEILEQCLNFFQKIKINKLKAVTSKVVIAEVVWVLKSYYKLSRSQISEAIKKIINSKGLKIIDDGDISLATELYQGNNIKYIDALIASIKPIFEKKWIIVSYDKDFDKLKIKRMEPGEI